jgi:hypothetical protein
MNRGDVVELDWPFSDRTGSKIRPAVVMQAADLPSPITFSLTAPIHLPYSKTK